MNSVSSIVCTTNQTERLEAASYCQGETLWTDV